jgi:hypothetical protein
MCARRRDHPLKEDVVPHSRITSAELNDEGIDVVGPFELSPEELKTTVPLTVHVVLIQGDAYAHGHTRPRDGDPGDNWVVHAEVAGTFEAGKPARGFGFASLVDEGAAGVPPRHDTLLWSEPVDITTPG